LFTKEICWRRFFNSSMAKILLGTVIDKSIAGSLAASVISPTAHISSIKVLCIEWTDNGHSGCNIYSMLGLRSLCPLQTRRSISFAPRLIPSRPATSRRLGTMAATDVKSRRRKDYGFQLEYRTRWQGRLLRKDCHVAVTNWFLGPTTTCIIT
jgi:hypothetical protein